MAIKNNNVLLFNPVSIVHDRNVSIFRNNLPDWRIRCIYNPKNPRLADMEKKNGEICFFTKGRTGREIFNDVGAVVLFTAQPRVPHAYLIQEAAFRGIPVVAIEEVYQMMFEQGFINEYLLPVDHLFVGSDYERDKFIEMGVPCGVLKTTGCVFSSRKDLKKDPDRTDEIKRRLNISKDKRIATLCLAYITPSGETLDIRRQLLSIVSGGLPSGYELLVKPHPAERTEDVSAFIKRYAPGSRIAGSGEPIDNILDFTDILFNRGNSQVVIDAVRRGIPVASIPLGRKTLFEGLLDDLIVRGPEDISKILSLIQDRGMKVYEPMLNRYLHVSPEESLKRTISGLVEIAQERVLYKPEERLLVISLFWAFMGYPSQALSTLSRLKARFDADRSIAEKIKKLILCKADRGDISFLKNWARHGYKEWVIKSLWIKTLYMTGKTMSEEDREWLAQFPPRTNREHFMPFARMLGWLSDEIKRPRSFQYALKDVLKDTLFKYGLYY